MKNFVTVAVVMTFLFLTRPLAAADIATLYFMHFEDETYVPVTKDTIRANADEKWVISDKQRIGRLMRIVTSGVKSTFEDVNVRAVLYANGKTYFINRDGDVEVDGNSTRIDLKEFLQFHGSLRDDEKRSTHDRATL
jgi:hypothetical protein